MIMNRAYKYRIYPSEEQKVLLNKTFGSVRLLWNHNVSIFNSFSLNGPNRSSKTSTELRHSYEWMLEVSAAAIQQKEIDFKAYKKSYFSKSRNKKLGRCSFKTKYSSQSFRLPNQKFMLGNHKIRLEKIGWIDIAIDRRPDKNCKFVSVTISKNKIGKFYASVLVEQEIKHKLKTYKLIGIDLGLKDFIITSDGDKVGNPKYLHESQMKLRKAQKNLSRKKKGSSRRRKCILKVARLHEKVVNQRKHFHHVVSSDLIQKYDFIGLEDLNVSGMAKNHKLAKAISDVAWSQFTSMLVYKAKWYGKEITKIGRFFPSSKTCSECGWVKSTLLLSEREFVCQQCGCVHDRDINAAINIKNESLRISAQGVACA